MAAYYRFFPGDYLRDTIHLGWLEDMAYRRLIDLYMSRGRPIANDRSYIMRAIRASEPEQQAAVDNVLSEFFTLKTDGWHQKKCDVEIDYQKDRSESAKKSAEKRWHENKDITNAMAMRSQCDGNANQNQNQNHINSKTTTPKKSPKQPSVKKTDTPLPAGWSPSGSCVDALKQELGLTDRELARYTVSFQDICASKGYRYKDHEAAFRNCVRADWPRLRQAPRNTVEKQASVEDIAREHGLRARPGESWAEFELRVRREVSR